MLTKLKDDPIKMGDSELPNTTADTSMKKDVK